MLVQKIYKDIFKQDIHPGKKKIIKRHRCRNCHKFFETRANHDYLCGSCRSYNAFSILVDQKLDSV